MSINTPRVKMPFLTLWINFECRLCHAAGSGVSVIEDAGLMCAERVEGCVRDA
jgi:hypothetical protein